MGLREDCWNYTYFMLEYIMYHIKNSKGGKMTFIADQTGLTYWNVAHVESTFTHLKLNTKMIIYYGFNDYDHYRHNKIYHVRIIAKKLLFYFNYAASQIFYQAFKTFEQNYPGYYSLLFVKLCKICNIM